MPALTTGAIILGATARNTIGAAGGLRGSLSGSKQIKQTIKDLKKKKKLQGGLSQFDRAKLRDLKSSRRKLVAKSTIKGMYKGAGWGTEGGKSDAKELTDKMKSKWGLSETRKPSGNHLLDKSRIVKSRAQRAKAYLKYKIRNK